MPGQAVVTINDKQWSVSVANTLAELTSGLSGVKSIPSQTGVLFDLGYDQKYIEIDMSRMLFALDIIFINSTQGVRGVMTNVQPGETDVRFEATTTPGARCFLEVNASEAEGIEVGDNVAIQGLVPQNAGLDPTGMMNFMVIMVVVIMMFRMVDRALEPEKKPFMLGGGKLPPGYEPVHHSSERRYGEPKTEAERGKAHERKYGTKELPERGKGLESVEGKKLWYLGEWWEEEYSTAECVVYRSADGKKRLYDFWDGTKEVKPVQEEHHSMWLTLEQRKELEEKYGAVTVRWAEEATRPGDIRGAEAAAEYYYGRLKEVFGLGHLSPELTEEQLRELREFLGLPADVAEVLKIHQETGYVP